MARHHLSPRLEAALRRQQRAARERADREEAGQVRLGLSAPVVEPEGPRLVIERIDDDKLQAVVRDLKSRKIDLS